MPHIVEDRILESTTTTGTGAITLVAALTGFRRFNAVCAVGDTVPYFIEAIDTLGLPTGDYEYGIATYSSANTLTRTSVKGSSNANALVNFSAGSKNVGMAALGGSLVPAGLLGEWLASAPPTGWLERDGSLLSRAAYPALWSHAQTAAITASDAAWATDKGKFSPGDGSTTFRLPDHRGQHMRGWDHGAGVDTGRALGSTQADALLAHTHAQGAGNGFWIDAPGLYAVNAGGSSINMNLSTATASTGGTENRVKNVAAMFIIKT